MYPSGIQKPLLELLLLGTSSLLILIPYIRSYYFTEVFRKWEEIKLATISNLANKIDHKNSIYKKEWTVQG
jgi:hypothetical protein